MGIEMPGRAIKLLLYLPLPRSPQLPWARTPAAAPGSDIRQARGTLPAGTHSHQPQ